MKKNVRIPAQDLKDINKTFESGNAIESIAKKTTGEVVSANKGIQHQEKSYVIKSYRGRTLKHSKSVIPKGGLQMTVGHKGQKFDDIPENLRAKVSWLDSDFE